MTTTNTNTNTQSNHAGQPEFAIQRVYVKDLSFEAPQSPSIFQQEWQPELNLQLQTSSAPLANDTHEVTLQITVTAKAQDKIIFLAELKQAGIFTLRGFPEEQIGPMLGCICPTILFPYGREAISDLVNRGTFPPLYLAPVNFEALYQQHLEQQKNTGNQASSIITNTGSDTDTTSTAH